MNNCLCPSLFVLVCHPPPTLLINTQFLLQKGITIQPRTLSQKKLFSQLPGELGLYITVNYFKRLPSSLHPISGQLLLLFYLFINFFCGLGPQNKMDKTFIQSNHPVRLYKQVRYSRKESVAILQIASPHPTILFQPKFSRAKKMYLEGTINCGNKFSRLFGKLLKLVPQ